MPAEDLVCWKCGHPLGDLPLRLSRLSDCKGCHAPLHVCRMCEFYDTSVANDCREPVAEVVKDKTRRNFCDYFRARPGAYDPPDRDAEGKAKSELDALFGLDRGKREAAGPPEDEARRKLDDLFK